MGCRTVASNWTLGEWGLVAALLGPGYPVRALDRASFSESIRTEVVTRIENSSRRRLVARAARFGVELHGDTVVVSADTLMLSELADGSSRTLDTDGFVGGRYLLLLDPTGRATLIERPFLPDDLAEVSDVGRAMDDFFPPLPPAIAVGGVNIDSAGRSWGRLSDSIGVRRYRWSSVFSHDDNEMVADSVPTRLSETTRESSTLAWHSSRGPLAWSRRIESEVTPACVARRSGRA